MRRAAAEFARNCLHLLYPETCLVCSGRTREPAGLRHGMCSACAGAVTTDPLPSCPWCAKSVGPYSDTTNGCLECRGTALGFERAFRLGPYDGPLRTAVLRVKHLSGEGLAEHLGQVFAELRGHLLRAEGIDLVVPVPLHWWRKWVRGYNQAEAVARQLAAGLGVGFAARWLKRVKWTPQQVQPTREARRDNVKGAFRPARGAKFAGKTVLLVDDVMTTGSTLGESARAVSAAGAERVLVAVLARK